MPADGYRDRSQSPAQSQRHAGEPPPGFFDQFLINSAPGQDHAERFARLCFPDYPNVPGDDDEVPTDSPLMTLLRENLPSMRVACRSQRREKGKSRREDQSGSNHHSTGSKGSHSDVVSTAHDYDNAYESISNRINELRTLASTFERRRDQRASDRQARRDLRRLYAERRAELQHEHVRKMQAMQMQRELKEIEHQNLMKEKKMELERIQHQTLMMEEEIRKLQREINQGLNMTKEVPISEDDRD